MGGFTLFLMTESLGGKQICIITTIYFHSKFSLVTEKYLTKEVIMQFHDFCKRLILHYHKSVPCKRTHNVIFHKILNNRV